MAAFSSAYQRIAWAEEHIVDLKERAHTFFASQRYERFSERDLYTSYTIDKVRLCGLLPDALTRLTVQTVENLRSALDHAACATVTIAANKKRTFFPFGDTKAQIDSALRTKCKYVPDEIKSIFSAFKPYKRGNSALWAINKLCNTHKHRMIIEPGILVRDVEIIVDEPRPWIVHAHKARWNRRTNEVILSITPGEGTVHHDADISIGVAFGKVPVFSGKPVLSGLRYMASIVQSIVMATEAEARSIGVVR